MILLIGSIQIYRNRKEKGVCQRMGMKEGELVFSGYKVSVLEICHTIM